MSYLFWALAIVAAPFVIVATYFLMRMCADFLEADHPPAP